MTAVEVAVIALFGVPFAIGCKQLVLATADGLHAIRRWRRDRIRRRSSFRRGLVRR